ncbi:MAG: 4Fe-4S binding protein [Sedimenticola sp.]|nr:4Fe-4S binding protein [Sedimenticola sp.]
MRMTTQEQADGYLGLSELIVEEELCLNLRGRLEHCTRCRDVCPSDALSLSADAVDLDREKCTGCNSCLPSCPAGALRSSGFVPERFIAALAGRERVDLHCRASTGAGGGVVIPCHAVLDARLASAARAEGVKTLALHGLDQCAECRYGDARAVLRQVVATLDQWMGEAAPLLDMAPVGALPDAAREYQDQPHLSRRAFLRFGGAQAMTQAVEWVVPGLNPEEEDGDVLPFFQSSVYPQRTVQYQAVLSKRVERVPWQEDVALPWKVRSVNDSCSGCLACGERCPTGALQARESSQARELSFDPLLCTDCMLCERLCPEGAMVPRPALAPEELETGRSLLFRLDQRPCGRCGTPFVPEEPAQENCRVCGNEQELDDAWLDMLSG